MQRAEGTPAATRLAVITNGTAAAISAAANTVGSAGASASAADALGSECPRVILETGSCSCFLDFICSLPVDPLP